MSIQRCTGLAIYIIERKQREGEVTMEHCVNMVDVLHMIRAETYACDPCCADRRIAFPSLQQLAHIGSVRIPHRLPTAAAQLLSEVGVLPSCYSHRRAQFL